MGYWSNAKFGYGINLGYEDDDDFPLRVADNTSVVEVLEEMYPDMKVLIYGNLMNTLGGVVLVIKESCFGSFGYHDSQKDIPLMDCKEKIPLWEERLKEVADRLGLENKFEWQMCSCYG